VAAILEPLIRAFAHVTKRQFCFTRLRRVYFNTRFAKRAATCNAGKRFYPIIAYSRILVFQ
jgi:hypothetical protein